MDGLLSLFGPDVVESMKAFAPTEKDRQNAMNMGLLQAGLGVLAGNRGYGKGQALQNAVGMGGIHGLNAYQNSIADAQKEQMRQIGLAQMMEGYAGKKRKSEQIANFRNSIPEADRGIFDVAPDEYIKNMPQFQKQQLVEIADPNEPLRTQKVWMRPGDTQGTVAGVGAMPEILDPRVQDAKRSIAAAGRPNIETKIINAAETEQAKAWGKNLGELRSEITKAGFNAPSQLAKLQRMEELLAGVEGGKLAPLGMEIASAAKSLGINIDPKLGNKEAAEALSREIAGGFRQPGTGPMTDKDFENFLKRVPDLSKTADGRKEIFRTMRATYNRDIAAGKLVKDYAKKKGGNIDDDFIDELANMYAQTPVVAPAPQGGGFKIIGAR